MSQRSPWQRSQKLLTPQRCSLIVIDVQERLLPAILNRDSLVFNIRFLMDAAELLKVRTIVTEQYPKGLGPTVSELVRHPAISVTLEKLRFSAAEILHDSNELALSDGEPRQIVLTGIETHICVQQTALDLISRGHSVLLATDATGSRHAADYLPAVERMRGEGVAITTCDAIAFEWCEIAGSDQFKALSRLVKARDEKA